jgi:alpha-tubulin suppressor-like RCC1 family protein
MRLNPLIALIVLCIAFASACASTVAHESDAATDQSATDRGDGGRIDADVASDAPTDSDPPPDASLDGDVSPPVCTPGQCPPRAGMRFSNLTRFVFREDGAIRVWGDNMFGAFGTGGTGGSTNVPAPGPSLGPLRQLGAGGYTTCALTIAGRVYCWGTSQYGELGEGAGATSAFVPTLVTLPILAVDLHVTANSYCALGPERTLWCWGLIVNSSGVLVTTTSPRRDSIPFDVDHFIASKNPGTDCAVDTRQSLWCRGNNVAGLLGVGGPLERGSFDRVPVPVPVLDAGVGGTTGCAVGTDGSVWCWGASFDGQVPGRTDGDVRPTRIEGVPPAVRVSVGQRHVCVVTRDGALWCWGSNRLGAVNPTTRDPVLLPQRVEGIPPVSDVSSFLLTCAQARTTGNIWCWGGNDDVPVETVVTF